MSLSFAGVSESLTIPSGFSVFTSGAPPWIVPKEAILGLVAGEGRPKTPQYGGAGPMPVGSWRENDLSNGLGDSASRGPVPASAVLDRLVNGLQFVPAKSGKAAPLWSTWHEGLLRALSTLFSSWNSEVANPALVIETGYASEAFTALADALAAVDTSHGSPRIDPKDPVLARANAYSATLVSWMKEHQEDILDGMLTYATTGAVTPALGSALTSVANGVAYLGPVGIIGISVAILGVAIYAFVTGARPGNTRGAGDDVLAFPRSGKDEDHIVYLSPVDVDAYTHAMYRAVLLDRQRRRTGVKPWEQKSPGFRPIQYRPVLTTESTDAPKLILVEKAPVLVEKAPVSMAKKVAVAAGVGAGAGLLWWGLKALGIVGRRSRR